MHRKQHYIYRQYRHDRGSYPPEQKSMAEVWISGDLSYPALAVLINGGLAHISFFGEDDDDNFASPGCSHHSVEFRAGGEMYLSPKDTVITIDAAISAVREFCAGMKRPECLEWQSGV